MISDRALNNGWTFNSVDTGSGILSDTGRLINQAKLAKPL